jgi:hypothetical protein
VAAAGDFVVLDFADRTINMGDTLGIYLHLQNAASNLSYLNTGGNLLYDDGNIQILGGTGISHTFGTTYSPRNWCGELFYHYGDNPSGDCASDRVPVASVISTPVINLGNDTTLYYNQAINLTAPNTFVQYQWSTTASTAQITIDSTNASLGANTISIQATDAYGCTANDTIMITFTVNTTVAELEGEEVLVFPNPSEGDIFIKIASGMKVDAARIYNLQGELCKDLTVDYQQKVQLVDLPKGLYLIQLTIEDKNYTQKIMLR